MQSTNLFIPKTILLSIQQIHLKLTTMSRPNRRMLTLPSAQELTQGTDPIRLRKKKDRFLFMTYNVNSSSSSSSKY